MIWLKKSKNLLQILIWSKALKEWMQIYLNIMKFLNNLLLLESGITIIIKHKMRKQTMTLMLVNKQILTKLKKNNLNKMKSNSL